VRFASGFGRRQVGYLSQQALQNKDFPASVQEVVSTGRLGRLGLRPYYSQADREAVSLSLARLQAEDLAKRSFNELSGGQRQRVLLARAICAAQRMLVLDEPATGLDVALQAELEQVIAELRAERGMAVVMVSHDVQGAVEHASHILHLNTSQEFFGTAAAYRASGIGDGFAGCVHVGHAPIAHGGRGGGSHA
jgi:zinc transport system ATP-binding protein